MAAFGSPPGSCGTGAGDGSGRAARPRPRRRRSARWRRARRRPGRRCAGHGRGSRRWAARPGSCAGSVRPRSTGLGDVPGPGGLLLQVPVEDLERGAAGERRTPGEQLVEEDAGAVDVDGGGLRAALGGLRGHVGRGADELVGAGEPRRVGEAGDAEVGEERVQLAAGLAEQHVGRLEVAVDDAVGVAGGERVGDLRGQQAGGDRGERSVLPQVAVEVGAVDQVHDEGEQVALHDEVADPDDVRVGEAEQDGTLAQEAHHDVRVARQLLLEDLDGDGLPGAAGDGRLGSGGHGLTGPPDGAGGAAPERLLQEVLAAYRPHVMRSLLIRWVRRPPGAPILVGVVSRGLRSGACGSGAPLGSVPARGTAQPTGPDPVARVTGGRPEARAETDPYGPLPVTGEANRSRMFRSTVVPRRPGRPGRARPPPWPRT